VRSPVVTGDLVLVDMDAIDGTGDGVRADRAVTHK
jgi:hypothetical protein